MAINNFKPFALDPNANVTSQADWEALPALLSGFTAGKASSAQVNKAIRQASFIAAALAQYTANKSGLDVLDDGDLNGFISKMGTAFGKDFQALDATLSALAGLATGANKLPYFTGNDTAAQTDLTSVGRDIIGKNTIADILTYLGAVDANGGDYNSFFNFKQVGTLGVDRNQNYLVSADDTVTGGLVAWLQNQWHDNSVKWGAVRGAGADLQCAAVSINEALILKIFADGRITALDKLLATQEWANTQFPLKTSLGNASTKTVGTGANQIPDMNSFQSGTNSFGTWMRLPSGIMVQFGLYPTSGPTGGITFPTPFTSAPSYSLSPTGISGIMAIASGSSLTGINDVRTFDAVGHMLTNGVLWIAIGR